MFSAIKSLNPATVNFMKKNIKYLVLVICAIGFFSSCTEDSLPKPKAFLALEYPNAIYKTEDIAKCLLHSIVML